MKYYLVKYKSWDGQIHYLMTESIAVANQMSQKIPGCLEIIECETIKSFTPIKPQDVGD